MGAVTADVPADFRDLSLDHTPLGCLASNKPGHKEWEQFKLTPEQVEQYWTNGYLSNIPVLSDDQCKKLLDEYKVFLVCVFSPLKNS